MDEKPKFKRKLKSANNLRKKKKKLQIEEMPEMLEFKNKANEGKMSKEETIDNLRKMMDVLKKRKV